MTQKEGSTVLVDRKYEDLKTELKVLISRFTDDLQVANTNSGDIIFPANARTSHINTKSPNKELGYQEADSRSGFMS